MNPKEKVEELVNKFMATNSVKLSDYSRIEFPTAKQCALICCDEILLTLNKDIQDINVIGNILLDLIKYWNNVKEELLKM